MPSLSEVRDALPGTLADLLTAMIAVLAIAENLFPPPAIGYGRFYWIGIFVFLALIFVAVRFRQALIDVRAREKANDVQASQQAELLDKIAAISRGAQLGLDHFVNVAMHVGLQIQTFFLSEIGENMKGERTRRGLTRHQNKSRNGSALCLNVIVPPSVRKSGKS